MGAISLFPRKTLCCSGTHFWMNVEDADKCCAGYVPVHVPMDFWYTPEAWAREPVERAHKYKSWIRILIPEQETALFNLLWARQPIVYQSPIGPFNRAHFVEN